MKVTVVINEQHSLFPEQVALLGGEKNINFMKVPATGWDSHEQRMRSGELATLHRKVVFASPVPLMLGAVAAIRGCESGIFVFHNDHREKKELSNGKVIQVVSQTGWQLFEL